MGKSNLFMSWMNGVFGTCSAAGMSVEEGKCRWLALAGNDQGRSRPGDPGFGPSTEDPECRAGLASDCDDTAARLVHKVKQWSKLCITGGQSVSPVVGIGYFPAINRQVSAYFCQISRETRQYSSLPRAQTFRVCRPVGYACLGLGLAGQVAAIELPSGVDVEVQEVLAEEIGVENWVRFRLLAPEIDRTRPNAPGFSELEEDFPHICTTLVLPYLATYDLQADRIVISLADRVVEFGVADPDATQYFEQFRIVDGRCSWEAF